MFSIHSDPLSLPGSHEAGGQNVYEKFLIKELDKLGWQVDIFTRLDDKSKERIAPIGDNSRVIRIPAGPVSYVPKEKLYELFDEFYNGFLSFIDNKNPYELFHGHYWDGGKIALMAHEQFKKPLIQNFHSLGRVKFLTQKEYLWTVDEKKIFEDRFELESKIADKASVIISLSESEKKDLKNLYEVSTDKIKVIPGGVCPSRFAKHSKSEAREMLNLNKDNFIILFVGRLEWRKGVGTLITATEFLKDAIPNIKTIIVGGSIFGESKNEADVKEYERLSEHARFLNIEDKIVFTGQISDEDIPSYYKSADIFVIPSYYEPFGLVALEAMAAKTPTIASRKGGLKTIIEDNRTGLLFTPRNPEDLKDKILKIYNSPELGASLAEEAYKEIESKYSWNIIVKKIADLYKSVL